MALSMFMNPFPYQHPFAAPRRSLFADFDDMFNEMSLSRPRYSYATPMVTARSYPDYATVYRRAVPAPTRRVVYRRPAVTIVQQPQVRVLRWVSEPVADEAPQRRLKRREAPTETAPVAIPTQSTESAAAIEPSAASPAVAQSPKQAATTTETSMTPASTASPTAVTANKRPRTTYEAEWSLSKDGSSYEWRWPIAAQATVSNVALQLTRNVQEPSHRVLQVTVDTEHREEVALFGGWPMVSVSQQTVTRRVSLPEDAKMEGLTVTLEESNEGQGGGDRTLLVKVPRQQAESTESAQPAENVVDTSDNHTDSATVSDNSVHASITASTTEPVDEESEQDQEAAIPSEASVAVEDTPVVKSDDDNASQVSSEVTVEDVEEEEEEDDGYVHA